MSLRRSLAAGLLAAAVLPFASVAQASPWVLAPGEFYTDLTGGFFSTRTYYGNDDTRTALGARFEQRTTVLHSEFGWKKRVTFLLDIPFVSRTFATPDGTDPVATPAIGPAPTPGSLARQAQTSAGLGDIGLGFRYGGHVGTLPMALELGWTAPLGTNRNLFPGTSGSLGLDGASLGAQAGNLRSDSSAFFSQGLQSLSAGLELGGTAGSRAFWTVGGGYRYRYLSIAGSDSAFKANTRRAGLWTYRASLGLWVSPSLLVSGEFRGETTSWQSGMYDGIPGGLPAGQDGPELRTSSRIAGPRLTYRVDDRMDVFAGSWHTPGGRNVLHHDAYYCGIAWKHTSLDRSAGALGGTKSR